MKHSIRRTSQSHPSGISFDFSKILSSEFNAHNRKHFSRKFATITIDNNENKVHEQ